MARKTATTTTTTAATVAELDGLVNLGTAAEILGVSLGTTKNMVSARWGPPTLPSVRLGGRRMVRRSVLTKFINSLEA